MMQEKRSDIKKTSGYRFRICGLQRDKRTASKNVLKNFFHFPKHLKIFYKLFFLAAIIIDPRHDIPSRKISFPGGHQRVWDGDLGDVLSILGLRFSRQQTVSPLLKRPQEWGCVGDVTTGAMKTHARSLQFIFVVRPPIYGITAIQKLPTPLMCWRYHKVFNYRICRAGNV